jgi:WD40 repeat protein
MRSGAEVTADDAGHRGYLSGIAVATNSLIATASDDHTARLWDPATGKLRRTIRHGHWVRAVALSPDGAKVATSSLDDTVTLWDAASGRVIYKLAGHGAMGGKRAVSFTADGKFIVSWGDDYYLRKWDVSTAKAVLEHPLRPTGIKVPDEDTEPMQRMEFLHMGEAVLSPGGKILVLGTALNFHVFEVATGKELRLIPNEGSNVVSLAISPDEKYLLTSAWGKGVQTKLPDGRTQFSSQQNQPICLWELSTGKLLKKVNLPEGGAGPVAFSLDGKRFAAATDRPDRRIRLWDVATGEEIGGIEGFRGAVRSLAFLPGGKRLISGMEDSSALVWDLTRKR